MIKRIILTGAHGTGKTTVLNMFKEAEYPVITEVVRDLSRRGIKINEEGDRAGQQVIFNSYYDLLRKDMYVSDRGLTDVIAYTKYLVDNGKIKQDVLDSQVDWFIKFHNENPDILYCYFPIEFDIEDDHVRSTSKDFQREVNDNIRWIMSIAAMESDHGFDFI